MTVPFTKYEAAYLLSAYLEGERSGIPRNELAKRCSAALRQMAINQGQRIDDTYRTAKGLTSRVMSIESAYKGRTIIQPATQLFAEIVEMYRNNRENYDKLLEKAKHMVEFDVENENATDSSSNRASDGVESVLPSRCGNHIIPEKLLLSIRQFYGNGMRFDETVFRLLEERSGTKVDKTIKNILQSNMFCRSDGLNFLPEMAGSKKQLALLERQTLLEKIANFGCVDLRALYLEFCSYGAKACLRNEDDLSDYLSFTLPKDIRIANALGTKIIRKIGISISETLEQSADKVVCAIKKGGCVTQDDLLLLFPVFSEQFLRGLLEKYTDGIIPAQINDFLCYQTIESLGLEADFSSMLNDILEETDKLSLSPTQEIVHAMVSVRLGYNLIDEFNIPDGKTFRRIISAYYTGNRPRVWRAGCFREVDGDDV